MWRAESNPRMRSTVIIQAVKAPARAYRPTCRALTQAATISTSML